MSRFFFAKRMFKYKNKIIFRLRKKPKEEFKKFGLCSKKAATVPQHAKCYQDMLKRQKNKQKNTYLSHLKNIIVNTKSNDATSKSMQKIEQNLIEKLNLKKTMKNTSLRLLRYMNTNNNKHKTEDWIGGFRLSKDTITSKFKEIPSKKLAYKFVRAKRSAIDYTENKNKRLNDQYTLSTPNSASPIGGVAKMLTKLLIYGKGKKKITSYVFNFNLFKKY